MAARAKHSGSRTAPDGPLVVRTQTGIRLERRLLKVMRGLADYHDMTLGDLLEGILLHVFEGKLPLGRESLKAVARLRKVYGLELRAEHSHRLREGTGARGPVGSTRKS
jgi:hypothetical protein